MQIASTTRQPLSTKNKKDVGIIATFSGNTLCRNTSRLQPNGLIVTICVRRKIWIKVKDREIVEIKPEQLTTLCQNKKGIPEPKFIPHDEEYLIAFAPLLLAYRRLQS